MPQPAAPRQVKVLRPAEGERPKVRVCNNRAVANREKALSSTMNSYFDYSKANAEYDRIPPGRFTDQRGARCAAAGRATTMDKVLDPSKAAYSEPPPPPRATLPATTANLARGRGRVNLFADKRPEEMGEDTSTPPVRCATSDAAANLRRSQAGSMAAVIVHSADHTDAPPALRGNTHAAGNAERARGSAMAATMDHGQARRDEPPKPRCVSAQALRQREAARGVMAEAMRGRLEGNPQPRPRLGHGAAGNAGREGGGLRSNLNQYGRHEVDAAPPPRVKPEAARNAAKNAGCLTALQYDYTYKNSGEREEAATRTRPGPAGQYKKASQGGATRNLFEKYGQLPGDLKPHARVQPRGRKIARMSSGAQISGMLNPPKARRIRRRPKSVGV